MLTDYFTFKGIAVSLLVAGFGGFCLGVGLYGGDLSCPAPDYDVDRVVKLHEEVRRCEAALEESRDNVLMCGRLLRKALE